MTIEASKADLKNIDVSYRRLFNLPGFPQLAAATVLARTGGQLWQVALVLFVLQRFHSPALAGFATFLAIAPGLAVSPIAGALLDRYGRLRLILIDLSIAATSLVLVAALSLANVLTPVVLLVIVALSSLTSPLTISGTRTLFPLAVPRELWDRANGVDSGSMALATVLGPALAGFLVAWFGGEGAFLMTAGVFVVAGAVLFGVREPRTEPSAQGPLLRAAWQSLVYVVRHPTLRGVIFTLWTTNIPYGFLVVALPVLILRQFQWGADAVGLLWSVAGVVTVVAGLLAGRINTEGRERPIIVVGLVLAALGCMCFLLQSPVALIAGMVFFGLAAGPIDIGLFALRQRRTDPRWFGRVFAVSMSLNFAGMPVGSALAGPIVERSIPLALIVAVVISAIGCVVPLLVIPREG
ncbi:MAG TPA: MFS transporter [Ktedonobacterales bacterium]|jgi:MFS family permease|nr:MFS transporter [Ktedonobacterales bacterium]